MLTDGIKDCAVGNFFGDIKNCAPLAATDIDNFSQVCPVQPQVVKEPATGMIEKLPGCIKITSGPADAVLSDMFCANPQSQLVAKDQLEPWVPELVKRATPVVKKVVGSYIYAGCYKDSSTKRALNAAKYVDKSKMTEESCVSFCGSNGWGFAGLEYSQE